MLCAALYKSLWGPRCSLGCLQGDISHASTVMTNPQGVCLDSHNGRPEVSHVFTPFVSAVTPAVLGWRVARSGGSCAIQSHLHHREPLLIVRILAMAQQSCDMAPRLCDGNSLPHKDSGCLLWQSGEKLIICLQSVQCYLVTACDYQSCRAECYVSAQVVARALGGKTGRNTSGRFVLTGESLPITASLKSLAQLELISEI